MKQSANKKVFDYKWIIIALCFLMVFVALGFCSSNRSLYLSAITDALDISRSAFSLSDSIRYIATAITNLFFGTLIAKFGSKKLICAGFICLIAFALISAFATNVFTFCLSGVFLGVGLSWTTTATVGYVVAKWSKHNKGTIMGAILAANGLGGALAAQIISPLIFAQGNPFGYRNAYFLVSILLLFVCLLILFLFKDAPEKAENQVTDSSEKSAEKKNWIGIEFTSALRKPFFFGAVICIFLTGLVLQGVTGVAATHMKDMGLDADFIATALSIHSISLTLFKFLTGFIYDKFGLRATVTCCTMGAIITMLSITFVCPTVNGMVLAIVYSVISALALPLETIMLPIYASDLFGEKSFDKIMGIFISANTTGYALGAVAINAVFDYFGSYTPAFIICAFIMVVVLILMQFIISSAHKERKRI